MDGFVEVLVTATGQTQMVPADWVDHPVLGNGIEKLPDPFVVEQLEAPTENDTHAVIDAFAQKAGIDLGEAKTRAEKVAVIDEVLAAAPSVHPEQEPVPAGNPDVQLVAGDEDDRSLIPALLNPTTADTESSDETPATGDEEN
jgi:hypothetical protein